MTTAAEIVYILCMIASAVCSWLLLRGYRRTGTSLLFWSALCFAGLCLNNLMLFLDVIVLPAQVDLSTWRLLPALLGIALLCYGLIRESA